MKTIAKILPTVKKDYSHIKFKAGNQFLWSPDSQQITFTSNKTCDNHEVWALLHEIAHAELNHSSYKSDFDLLKLESKTWSHAKTIAARYNIVINEDHIQDCLDTYRDWLHNRACCPKCAVVTLQRSDLVYQCFNCRTSWCVPKSPLCKITKRIVTK